MYSYEKRMKAVQLFIESDFNERYVFQVLGYPSPNALRNWYREYATNGILHSTCASKPKYTEMQKMSAIAYFELNHTTLTQTCRAMGYPTRNVLREWILEYKPQLLTNNPSPCEKSKSKIRYTREQKQSIIEELLVDEIPDYIIAAQYNISRATLFKWKKQLLGEDVVAFMNNKDTSLPNTDKATLEAEIANLQAQIKELQMEKDALKLATELLKKAGGINLTQLQNVEKAEVIDAMRASYRLTDLLKLFCISKSSYFYSINVLKSKDKYAAIRTEITEIFHNNESCYGYRRIYLSLKKKGIILSEKVIRRIMQQEHLNAVRPRRKKYSSYIGEISPAVPNILERNFQASAPNQKWLTDLTEFALPAGKIYLSPIIDCFDGLVTSWTIGTHPNAELVNQMLDKAISSLSPEDHPIVHSDRGCHYRWPGWIERMNRAGLIRSMSKKGCSPDNSACEGFFGRIKNEMFYGRSWQGVSIERFAEILDQYIHWYNEKRIKQSLGGMSPVEYRYSLGLL